jgi:hypothetical protein
MNKTLRAWLLAALAVFGGSSLEAHAQGAVNRVRTLSPVVGRYITGLDANGVWQTEEPSLTDLLSRTVLVTAYMTDAERADIASGNPTLNIKAALDSASNVLGAGEGLIIFPDGDYRWDSPWLLPSGRHIQCNRARFKPIYSFTLIANTLYGTTNLQTDHTPPIDENLTNKNYSVVGCTFDWRGMVAPPNASPNPIGSYDIANGARFLLAQNVYFAHNHLIASDPPKFDGSVYYGFASAASCVQAKNCTFESNLLEGIHDGFDCWGGVRNCTVKNNRHTLPANDAAGRGNGYCVGINGMGSLADFHLSTEDVEVSGNYCVANGGGHSCIQFDPLSAGSHVKRIKITHNTCIAKAGSVTNFGIYGRGQVEDVLIDGNTIDGFGLIPLQVSDSFSSGGPFTCTDCITTTAGSKLATVAIPGYTATKVTVGNYISFSSASTVGGVAFAGKYFRVKAVAPGVSATVEMDSPAGSSQTGGGSVSTQVWWGAPNRVRIINNALLNSGYPGDALIRGQGENIQIGDNSAVNETFGPFTCTDCITTDGTTTAVVAMADFTAETARVNDYLRFGPGVSPVGGVTFANKNFKITAVNPGVSVSVLMDGTATVATGGGSVSATVQRGIYGSITFASSALRGTTLAPAPVVWGTSGATGTGMAGASGDAIDSYPASRHPQTSFPSIVIPHGNNPSALLKKDGQLWSEIAGFRARVGGVDTTFADLERAQTFTGAKTFGNYTDFTEIAAPPAPAANTARVYADDNGAGKTRLMVRFPTGAVQQLAIEP